MFIYAYFCLYGTSVCENLVQISIVYFGGYLAPFRDDEGSNTFLKVDSSFSLVLLLYLLPGNNIFFMYVYLGRRPMVILIQRIAFAEIHM